MTTQHTDQDAQEVRIHNSTNECKAGHRTTQTSFTIFGFCNSRYFCGPNPRGAITWYDTRAARDAAVARLEAAAARAMASTIRSSPASSDGSAPTWRACGTKSSPRLPTAVCARTASTGLTMGRIMCGDP